MCGRCSFHITRITFHITNSSLKCVTGLTGAIYVTHVTWALQSLDLSGEGINFGSHTYYFDHTRTWPDPQMRDQLNAWATSETTTWKTIYKIQAPIHSSKANMKGRLWRPNYIRGPCGPKDSWYSSHTWGKTPKEPHPVRLSRWERNPGPLHERGACYRLLHGGGLNNINIGLLI